MPYRRILEVIFTANKLKYKTPAELQTAVDKFFADCEGKKIPPTVTGLALALGFKTRQSLINYQGRTEFEAIITVAKTRCEEYAERRLFDRDGAPGAKFSLQNNFKGWNGENSGSNSEGVKIVDDV